LENIKQTTGWLTKCRGIAGASMIIRQFTLCIFLLPFGLSAQIARSIPAPDIDVASYILIEQSSGDVLAEKKADERVEPASITKIMTSYVAGQALKEGLISLDDEAVVSTKAWKMGGSKMFIEAGKKVTVDQLLDGIIVQSGNDASVALAEHIAGTEKTFAVLMNDYAKKLGMSGSSFSNASGYPDAETYVTARDVAILSRALIRDFPKIYERFSKLDYTFNKIKQPNRNRLLNYDPTVDGIKTGHTEKAGYCLAASANRDGMRLVSVTMGASSDGTRVETSRSLLNYGYRFFASERFHSAGEFISDGRVWGGDSESVRVGALTDVIVVIPRGSVEAVSSELRLNKPLMAPLKIGQEIGHLALLMDGDEFKKFPIVALDAVNEGSIISSFWDKAILLFETVFEL
jgi:D-alanyl-D-alanine carboxypeptidase (penicillin-binding protein 5/6)